MSEVYSAFYERLGYSFKDVKLLRRALTHTSYANEHQKTDPVSNERLEFLGDAVLDLAAAYYLFSIYPSENEGNLSRKRAAMVSEQPLAKCARSLGINGLILLGKGEETTGGRDRNSILSDAMEAVIGAVYIDGGYEAASKVVVEHILKDLGERDMFDDKRSPLQEYFQDRGKTLTWHLVGEEGPPHGRLFKVEAHVDGEVIGRGEGKSKKAAAQSAANDALLRLKIR